MPNTPLSLVWDSTRLRLLVEIGRQGSVSAAARAVGIGQPTASEHLRTLEGAAGQQLVERTGRGSKLTEAGQVLALHAAQALQTLDTGEEELRRLAGLEAGTIRVGASTTPGVYLLPDTLGCFRRDHPNVSVEVEIASTGEILARLLAGRVQLALVGEVDADDRVALEPFLADEIVGVARPGALTLQDGRARKQELAEQTLLVRERDSSTRRVTSARSPTPASGRRRSGRSTRAKRSSAPRAKGSESPSSPATQSPRRSSAASWSASGSPAGRRSSAGSSSRASLVGRSPRASAVSSPR